MVAGGRTLSALLDVSVASLYNWMKATHPSLESWLKLRAYTGLDFTKAIGRDDLRDAIATRPR